MEKITNYIAAASASSIALSVCYNISYFYVVKPEFIGAITIQDHISSGITFLPIFVISMIISSVFGLAMSEAEIKSISEKENFEDEIEKINKKKRILYILTTSALVILSVILFLSGDKYKTFAYLSTLILLLTGAQNTKLVREITKDYGSYVLIMSYLLSGTTLMGVQNAFQDIRSKSNKVIIITENNNIEASSIRVFHDSIMYISVGVPHLLNSSYVSEITYENKQKDLSGSGFCEYLNLCLWKDSSSAH